ncbi:hypothetical protein CRUP_015856 [Coryphaenoides rupestris]|nr:hypothetical protein CRUP_015856 [Coryphaenoides rupestris]
MTLVPGSDAVAQCPEGVVATVNYRAHCPEEMDLNHGDTVQVLSREDPLRWFGRLPDGTEGYFPSSGESGKATPSLLRRCSVPVVMATPASSSSSCILHPGAGNGLAGTPRPPRKNSVGRALALDGPPAAGGGGAGGLQGSPSILHRVLARSRRKSCPHLPHASAETGSVNSAYLPD